jgi:hypothetical protein
MSWELNNCSLDAASASLLPFLTVFKASNVDV